jgi:hypothetical protein
LHREGARVEASDLTPVVFVVADQNFPPVLQVSDPDDGECFKIFRVEDAGLHELVGTFLEATRGFIVPAGRVVLLTSISHLVWVGTAAYAQEFTSARRRLRGAFGNGIEVLHGPPVLLDGISNSTGTLAVLDFFNWLKLSEKKKRHY